MPRIWNLPYVLVFNIYKIYFLYSIISSLQVRIIFLNPSTTGMPHIMMYTIYTALTVYEIVLHILEPHNYPDRNKDDCPILQKEKQIQSLNHLSWFCPTNLQELFTVLNICSKFKKLPEQKKNLHKMENPCTLLLPGKLLN